MTLQRDLEGDQGSGAVGEQVAQRPEPHVLDNPAWAALIGPQSHLGEVRAKAARFRPDVSPFNALADPHDPESWRDLAALIGPGATTAVTGVTQIPAGWTVLGEGAGVQLTGEALEVAADPQAQLLTSADVPDMLALVERTKPGPFLPRTIEMGSYWGIKDGGRLLAMAGERLHPPGWTEISAVCTDAAYRGQGLATRLVRTVGEGIRRRGDVPFLHASATNVNAIQLYEGLGFVLRRRPQFVFLRSPDA